MKRNEMTWKSTEEGPHPTTRRMRQPQPQEGRANPRRKKEGLIPTHREGRAKPHHKNERSSPSVRRTGQTELQEGPTSNPRKKASPTARKNCQPQSQERPIPHSQKKWRTTTT